MALTNKEERSRVLSVSSVDTKDIDKIIGLEDKKPKVNNQRERETLTL